MPLEAICNRHQACMFPVCIVATPQRTYKLAALERCPAEIWWVIGEREQFLCASFMPSITALCHWQTLWENVSCLKIFGEVPICATNWILLLLHYLFPMKLGFKNARPCMFSRKLIVWIAPYKATPTQLSFDDYSWTPQGPADSQNEICRAPEVYLKYFWHRALWVMIRWTKQKQLTLFFLDTKDTWALDKSSWTGKYHSLHQISSVQQAGLFPWNLWNICPLKNTSYYIDSIKCN